MNHCDVSTLVTAASTLETICDLCENIYSHLPFFELNQTHVLMHATYV